MSDLETWRGLLTGLLDDAAALPGTAAPVDTAVARHRVHRRAWYADVVGPLVLTTGQVPDLLAALRPGDDLAVALVADGGLVELAHARDLLLDREDLARLVRIEVPLPPAHDPAAAAEAMLDALAFATQAHVAIPLVPGWERAVEVLAADGAERAALRVGGPAAVDVPGAEDLAAFVRACLDHGLAFALTGGGWPAVRHLAPEGVEQHGLLNVLAAVGTGLGGAGTAEIAAVLDEHRHEVLLARLASVAPGRVRRAVVGLGCADLDATVRDLVRLGLLVAGPG